jgi:Mg-chelatase subunit ChlD
MSLSSEKRPNIDLICVIDVSGSMMGEKINLVRETLL